MLNNRLFAALAAAALAAASPTAGRAGPADEQRITGDELAALVAGPAALMRKHDFDGAEAAFARLLAEQTARHGANSVAVADHLMAFGLTLFEADFDDELREEGQPRSLVYLRRAIPAYRNAFGGGHEEVALAINSYADAALIVSPELPPPDLDALLEEAVRIRGAGKHDPAALANLIMTLGDVKGAPSRVRLDPAAIEASAAAYRRAMPLLALPAGSPHLDRPFRAHFRMAAMYVRNRRPAEAQAAAAEAASLYGATYAPDQTMCADLAWQLAGLASVLDEHGFEADASALRERYERELPCFKNMPRDVPEFILPLDPLPPR